MEAFAASERRIETTVCHVCGGFARFCKITTCPFYKQVWTERMLAKVGGKVVYGPSPPTVIVGEKGYPRLRVGPAVSLHEQAEPTLEDAGKWLEMSLDELLKLRLSLFYGTTVRHVKQRDRTLEAVRESAVSAKPVDVEVVVEGRTVSTPGFGVRRAPYGPSAKIGEVKLVGNVSVPRKVDSLVNDPYVSAAEALHTLYSENINEYYLTRVFSAGLLGRTAERKLVPTEWSITAVDDILSKKFFNMVRRNNVISEYRVHSHQALENAAHIILTPTPWMYELLEGWLRNIQKSPYADHEYLQPRKTYAENTGGAYYAVRLSVLRHLSSRKEQAGAIVFFEVYPGWIPLGVWRFREIAKKALEKKADKHATLDEALESVAPRLRIHISKYIAHSSLIKHLKAQQQL
ncbi:MAG: hypothetical protein NZ570_07125 [Candidatus Caldarchaeum sp.]|nr:hypothetical protein [Candidatus Caldarchaeum sp.]